MLKPAFRRLERSEIKEGASFLLPVDHSEGDLEPVKVLEWVGDSWNLEILRSGRAGYYKPSYIESYARVVNGEEDTHAQRHNSGKPRFDWIPPEAELALAELMTEQMGEGKKYPARNWEKGMDWSKCYASARRHMNAWMLGETADPESGRSHLDHALWNLMVLVTYERRGIGNDDRRTSV